MISDLFINFTILASLIVFGNQIYREVDSRVTSKFLKEVIIAGTLAGIIGSVLIVYSSQTIKGFLIDFSNIAIIISGIYFSLPTAILASIIIYGVKILTLPVHEFGYLGHFITGLSVAVGCGVIGKLKIERWKKWVLECFWVCFVFVANLIITPLPPLPAKLAHSTNEPNLILMIVIYCSGTILVCSIVFYLMDYIILTNHRYMEIKEAALKDSLTGLNNIREFDRLLNNALEHSKEKNENLSMLFLDVDYFKRINDTYGHPVGDKILKEISSLLQENSRPGDVISRNGGEEFSIILLNCSLQQAVNVAERIRTCVAQYDFIIDSDETIHVTVSIGISSFPETTNQVDQLVRLSDRALYEAKNNGRNKVVVANDVRKAN
ncbi:GGDEF domain-containing protein [Desulfosporosinus acidiphilus]|nr:GGDEF domain-containing protein [Desulfosporosinus acidiphilus]